MTISWRDFPLFVFEIPQTPIARTGKLPRIGWSPTCEMSRFRDLLCGETRFCPGSDGHPPDGDTPYAMHTDIRIQRSKLGGRSAKKCRLGWCQTTDLRKSVSPRFCLKSYLFVTFFFLPFHSWPSISFAPITLADDWDSREEGIHSSHMWREDGSIRSKARRHSPPLSFALADSWHQCQLRLIIVGFGQEFSRGALWVNTIIHTILRNY